MWRFSQGKMLLQAEFNEQSRAFDIFNFSVVTYLHVWAGRIYLTRKMLRQEKCSAM